jgi:hypothetical protein
MELPLFAGLDLDEMERIALAAKRQMEAGGTEWPGKPSRQRLDLFLAATPDAVLALIRMARHA